MGEDDYYQDDIDSEVVMMSVNGNVDQLWFWDGIDNDLLRNKMYPNRVIDA